MIECWKHCRTDVVAENGCAEEGMQSFDLGEEAKLMTVAVVLRHYPLVCSSTACLELHILELHWCCVHSTCTHDNEGLAHMQPLWCTD